MASERKGGRKPTGTLIPTKEGLAARVPIIVGYVEGKPVREKRWFKLGTDNKALARAKLARLIAEAEAGNVPAADDAARPETVAEYAERWNKSRTARGVRCAHYEKSVFESVWKPAIGDRQLAAVTAAEIRAVLEDVAAGLLMWKRNARSEPQRYSRASIVHMRATIFRLFQAAWKDELVAENRVARVEVPELEEEKKARAVLTDQEIGQLVAHPDVDAEIKLLVVLSRTIGGLRAGDLNALDWASFGPDFATCTFVRRKTRKKRPMPQTLEVPAVVRPFIAAWWERHERPSSGPVFPVRKGKRAGEQKKASNMSYADRLRRALLVAGIERHELHHDTPTTRQVDFHSTRRAYATALARVGVNEQTAMQLTGHADSKVHRGYVEAASIQVLPAAAVPKLDAGAVRTLALSERRGRGKVRTPKPEQSQCRRSDLNRRPHAYEARALTS